MHGPMMRGAANTDPDAASIGASEARASTTRSRPASRSWRLNGLPPSRRSDSAAASASRSSRTKPCRSPDRSASDCGGAGSPRSRTSLESASTRSSAEMMIARAGAASSSAFIVRVASMTDWACRSRRAAMIAKAAAIATHKAASTMIAAATSADRIIARPRRRSSDCHSRPHQRAKEA